jgi:YbgC/YbaW family acyl-CoA thioester hydrolase
MLSSPVVRHRAFMTTPFRTSRRVEFADTDMAGIVHFANFFRYMESAEVDFLASLNLSVAMNQDGRRIGFPRVAAACDYLHPVTFLDVLDITVVVDRIGKKSVTYRFEFSKSGQRIAHGHITAVCCRVIGNHQIESIEIPQPIRQKLEAAMAKPG